jgi:hypothetical protein
MKITTLPLAILFSLCPSLAQAQVSLHIDIGLPVAPPLVEVAPGVQVVEGFREEVFFRDGWYWCRRPDGWYRAHSPQARFDRIDAHRVPRALMSQPEGRYRNWHRENGNGRFSAQPNPGHGRPGPGNQGQGHGHGRDDSHPGKGKRPFYPPQNP